NVTNIFIRAKYVRLYDRLPEFLDHARIGQVRRISDQKFFAPRCQNFVDHAWARREDVHVVLTSKACLDNLDVEQTEESAANPESERDGTYRRVDKCVI